MLSAEEFARVKVLYCISMGCTKCILEDETYGCYIFQIKYPAEAVKRVELWWNEHRHEFDALIKILNENKGE